jgi:hypothetical protein
MSETHSEEIDVLVAEFDRKYMWWRPVDGGSHAPM